MDWGTIATIAAVTSYALVLLLDIYFAWLARVRKHSAAPDPHDDLPQRLPDISSNQSS